MLNGAHDHQIEAVFEFPSTEVMKTVCSDAYQVLIPIREEVAHIISRFWNHSKINRLRLIHLY